MPVAAPLVKPADPVLTPDVNARHASGSSAVQTLGATEYQNLFMNPMLLEKARETVGNDKILVNLVSRRVRQLNATSRPLV